MGIFGHPDMSSSNFRKIKSSYREPHRESCASASNPSQSTSESTGSDPRRPCVDKDIPAESSSSSSKHRRVPGSVTRNACLNCKKARTKCDGNKPCKRCATRVENSECIYEVHIKQVPGLAFLVLSLSDDTIRYPKLGKYILLYIIFTTLKPTVLYISEVKSFSSLS